MGTTTSAPLIAFHVSELGLEYETYAKAIKDNGIDGALLATFEREELFETMDELEIANRAHRRQLCKEFRRAFASNRQPARRSLSDTGRSRSKSPVPPSFRRSDTATEALRSYRHLARSTSEHSVDLIIEAERLKKKAAPSSRQNAAFPNMQDKNDVFESFKEMARKNSEDSFTLLQKAEQIKQETDDKRNKYCKAPTCGQVTIVLTDVKGSTLLWESNPLAMRRALNLHDKIIRRVNEEMHGYEIDTEGDAFFLAFHEPADALQFCLKAQQALREASWCPDIMSIPVAAQGLQVRMTVHCGDAKMAKNPVTQRTQYEGPAMRFVKSLESCTDGGQILCSMITWMKAKQTSPNLFRSTKMAVYGIHAGDGVRKPIVEIAPSTGTLLTPTTSNKSTTTGAEMANVKGHASAVVVPSAGATACQAA